MNAVLSIDAIRDIYRVLVCFQRFDDFVAVEVNPGQLLFTGINTSHSAFLLVTFYAGRFDKYEYHPPILDHSSARSQQERAALAASFKCKLPIRPLLAIFKSAGGSSSGSNNFGNRSDPYNSREHATTQIPGISNGAGPGAERGNVVEACHLVINRPPPPPKLVDREGGQSESSAARRRRLAQACYVKIRLDCRNGVRKLYRLSYELQEDALNVVVDGDLHNSRLRLPARSLREVLDQTTGSAATTNAGTGAGGDELTMQVDTEHNLHLTSFTELITAPAAATSRRTPQQAYASTSVVLRQPVYTTVVMDHCDAIEFDGPAEQRTTFAAREFKAVIHLCDQLGQAVSPIISFGDGSVPLVCDFTARADPTGTKRPSRYQPSASLHDDEDNQASIVGKFIVSTTAAGASRDRQTTSKRAFTANTLDRQPTSFHHRSHTPVPAASDHTQQPLFFPDLSQTASSAFVPSIPIAPPRSRNGTLRGRRIVPSMTETSASMDDPREMPFTFDDAEESAEREADVTWRIADAQPHSQGLQLYDIRDIHKPDDHDDTTHTDHDTNLGPTQGATQRAQYRGLFD
ncbi:hypothetical protein PYCC9005_003631 [Savitreella phatthalungensis]